MKKKVVKEYVTPKFLTRMATLAGVASLGCMLSACGAEPELSGEAPEPIEETALAGEAMPPIVEPALAGEETLSTEDEPTAPASTENVESIEETTEAGKSAKGTEEPVLMGEMPVLIETTEESCEPEIAGMVSIWEEPESEDVELSGDVAYVIEP